MVFHLAIPAYSLVESKLYYETLGAIAGREYSTHIVFNFFGCQLVIHHSEEMFTGTPQMYPRHFGIVVPVKYELELLWDIAKERGLRIFRELFVRHEGQYEEHTTFFLLDPSNNVIEIKHYKNSGAIFS